MLVIAADTVVHRLRAHGANDGQLIRVTRVLGQVFADLDSVDVRLDRPEGSGGRTSGFHVESVDLAHAAFHVEHDAAFT